MSYAELLAASAFSFLEGAAHPEALVTQAAALGHGAIGIADRNTVAGVVQAHVSARGAGLRLLVGARLVLQDAPALVCYPENRAGWGRLCRLLTIGKARAKKGDCALNFADVLAHAQDQVFIAVPPPVLDDEFADFLRGATQKLSGQIYLAAIRRYAPDDEVRLYALRDLAQSLRVKLIAANDVLYHNAEARVLQDVLRCIGHGCRIEEAGYRLEPNGERHLKPPEEMARLFAKFPEAIETQQDILRRVNFSLDEISYEYPDEPVPPGSTPDAHLAELVAAGAAKRYPAGTPGQVRATIEKELRVIAELQYARYFLTVNDIVQFARGKKILCQGRGSAANSAICYVLGITAVDPAESDLLFERFISAERREPPDIDVDFEHERREEVIQYLYTRYGRHRAAIAATVIHYRPKSAIREVAKALGLAEEIAAALAAQSWNPGDELWSADRLLEAGIDPEEKLVKRTVALARELVGLPRHLSQHVGGFVLTRGRLDETVPIGPAAMENRSFIEWDKDDIDALRMMKVDILALGMLTCIRKCFAMLGIDDLADIPKDDPLVYDMLCKGDSLGVFQVESRAQMNMLPRLKPRVFYDLVIEVAIVRPGPIQGDMVHPYLRRRQGKEDVSFPEPHPDHGPPDELRRVLGKTLGVPLFQEQAMRIAIEAAKFTAEEANALRRAMATFRNLGTIHKFNSKMVEGMVKRGYARAFAEACFKQIEGFGTYGFPESHAASFALLVYVSAWLKCHHPAAFAAALLNSQPMGFYAPAQIIRDAREHGVNVLPPDVNFSAWDCTLTPPAHAAQPATPDPSLRGRAAAAAIQLSVEDAGKKDGLLRRCAPRNDGLGVTVGVTPGQPYLRLGFRLIDGFHEAWAAQITESRGAGYADLHAITFLPRPALEHLAQADALRSLNLNRRIALWRIAGLESAPALPLFAGHKRRHATPDLPVMSKGEHVIADYRATGFSVRAHPCELLRPKFSAAKILTCKAATSQKDNTRIRTAGIVTVRQRPGTAKGTVFITIEDETGIANIIVWPSLVESFRNQIINAALLIVQGRMQRSEEGVTHIIAEQLADRTRWLAGLDAPMARADELPQRRPPGHPRNERVVRKSRDFH
jgi:error-prone DNA polymerase